MKTLALFTIALLAAQCNTPAPAPAPTPVPVPDAGAAGAPPAPPPTAEQAACDNLARVGCPEGEDPLCVAVLTRGETLTKVPLACLAGAKSAAAVQACGFVRCKP